MADRPVIVAPGAGTRVGNVEFLARTADTPRFNFGIVEIQPGRVLEQHVHDEEDDAFYILEGEMTFTFGDDETPAPPGTFVLVPPGVRHGFRNDGTVPVRMFNIHAPGGFDRRIGLAGGIVGRMKGSSFWIWFLIAAILPVLGLVGALLYRSERDEPTRACPGCGRIVAIYDAICTRCGTELDYPEEPLPPPSGG